MTEPLADTSSSVTGATTTTAPTSSSTSYEMVSSYSTVQQLSPTLINNVVYCTIKTHPSGVIASLPIDQVFFDAGTANVQLADFASAIEVIMAEPYVVAGVGNQSLDHSGLLVDNVTFTVQYMDPVHAPYGATAEATIPVKTLNFSDPTAGYALRSEAQASIDLVYANLQAAAGG